MISIIIPTLNEEKFLPHLLTSLTQQTIKDFEVIVVDGNSKDKTVVIAQTYQKQLHMSIEMMIAGVSKQRNAGAKIAKGDWLIFIDADSILLPYALERIEGFIKKYNPTIFTSWFSSDTDSIADAMVILFINMAIEGAMLLHRPVAQGPFTGVTRAAFMNVGGYDETRGWGEDYDLTKRICQKGLNLLMLRETLYIYSLRRLRNQGTIRVMQMYTRAVFSVLLTNKTPRFMPGYVMGGQPYGQKKRPIRLSMIKKFRKRLSEILNELFM
jgi:glycosyltransferase involved in cell wall biosynthesis